VPDANPPRLLSFTLDGWSVLGGPVTVSLEDRVAVLVGRNGAGKSAILEGFEAIAARAIGQLKQHQWEGNIIENIPTRLEIELLTPENRRLSYKYDLISLPFDDPDKLQATRFSWNDCCQYMDGDQQKIWTTKNGAITLSNNDNPSVITFFGEGIYTLLFRQFLITETHAQSSPDEMLWTYSALRGIRLVGKTTGQQGSHRSPIFFTISSKGKSYPPKNLPEGLSQSIFKLEVPEREELQAICERVGIGRKLDVYHFTSPMNSAHQEDYQNVSVNLDGVNIGLLSDGTLRILSILLGLVTSLPGATIIIEEPEIQIHPGLLEKLLNEIEAYSFADNLILSSHSPQVVAWTKPDKINLVHRQDDRTYTRKLGEDDIHQVTRYLQEDGNLGEWIYSGILDE
jgi:energy-coupling factor transporter ATP-binding protein EcfA2